MYANSLLGVWPYVFQDSPTLHKLYNIYFKFTFYYFLLFILSTVMQLVVLLTAEELKVEEIVANLAITLLYPITARRVWVIRSKKMKNLIKQVLVTEETIFRMNEEEITKIYQDHVKQNRIWNLAFLVSISVQIIFYFIHPLYVPASIQFDHATNQTTVIRLLPMSSWFPYDPQQHYLASYLWQMFDGVMGASFVMFADVFSFSMIIFALGQIRILSYVLKNLPQYALKVKERLHCSSEEASFLSLRECIVKHKEIISYLDDYNSLMRNIMVLDFLQSSLQLASIVIELVVTNLSAFNVVFYGEFAICMLIRLLVYYWYANEIMLESINISTSVYECGWYGESEEVKKMMLVLILRSNKPLGLDIGPFTTMTLNTFLAIIKTTYSYMMVMYR